MASPLVPEPHPCPCCSRPVSPAWAAGRHWGLLAGTGGHSCCCSISARWGSRCRCGTAPGTAPLAPAAPQGMPQVRVGLEEQSRREASASPAACPACAGLPGPSPWPAHAQRPAAACQRRVPLAAAGSCRCWGSGVRLPQGPMAAGRWQMPTARRGPAAAPPPHAGALPLPQPRGQHSCAPGSPCAPAGEGAGANQPLRGCPQAGAGFLCNAEWCGAERCGCTSSVPGQLRETCPCQKPAPARPPACPCLDPATCPVPASGAVGRRLPAAHGELLRGHGDSTRMGTGRGEKGDGCPRTEVLPVAMPWCCTFCRGGAAEPALPGAALVPAGAAGAAGTGRGAQAQAAREVPRAPPWLQGLPCGGTAVAGQCQAAELLALRSPGSGVWVPP